MSYIHINKACFNKYYSDSRNRKLIAPQNVPPSPDSAHSIHKQTCFCIQISIMSLMEAQFSGLLSWSPYRGFKNSSDRALTN